MEKGTAAAAVATKADVTTFENCKSLVVLKPKTTAKSAFIYRNINDLKALIEFVKAEPKVKILEGKLQMHYSKINLFDNSVVLLSEVGKVSEILTFAEAELRFDIAAQK